MNLKPIALYRDRIPIVSLKKRLIPGPKPNYPDPPISEDERPFDPICYEECMSCRRLFRIEVITRHLKICANVYIKKATHFESWRQRLAADPYSLKIKEASASTMVFR